MSFLRALMQNEHKQFQLKFELCFPIPFYILMTVTLVCIYKWLQFRVQGEVVSCLSQEH